MKTIKRQGTTVKKVRKIYGYFKVVMKSLCFTFRMINFRYVYFQQLNFDLKLYFFYF